MISITESINWKKYAALIGATTLLGGGYGIHQYMQDQDQINNILPTKTADGQDVKIPPELQHIANKEAGPIKELSNNAIKRIPAGFVTGGLAGLGLTGLGIGGQAIYNRLKKK